ncbi:MAG: mandelate racemase/muconate lactonizing enzyme family protein [Actinomycetia bacterium]|nr:mandelate racemase/muconate lactonizing enzyme family protein [Actinomycetes bacterium]MCP4961692.1 mandelate racemase/muconate lactonizing enzyme family protein [Actinomycetes bacterium]
MKLKSATAYAIRTPPPNLGGYFWYFVRLETDTGLVGWGEAAVLFTMYKQERTFEAMVAGTFNRFLEGKDPRNREVLNRMMYAGLSAQRPDYFVGGIISAFDTALWDICGKYYEAPVADLLGGRFRERIRTYTYLYDVEADGDLSASTTNWSKNPEWVGEIAARIVGEGFTGVKLDPVRYKLPGRLPMEPFELSLEEYDLAEQIIASIRDAIGNRADILIGTHGQITPSVSRRLAARLEKYDPLWLEEPCPPENMEEMARIAASTSIPVATGERLVHTHEFQRLFAAGACAFAQPDMGSCGGITAAKQISSLAEVHYVLMAPHVWGGPVITAAAMQIDAAIPNFLIQESIYKSRGFFDEIVVEPFEWEDGDLLVTDRPGIGIELDVEALAPYAI